MATTIPFHDPSVTKPQLQFDIAPNNSNEPFPHKFLLKNEAHNLKPIHPLESFPPCDFMDEIDTLNGLKLTEPHPIESTPFKLVEEVDDLKELEAKLNSVDEFAVDLEHNQYRSFQGLTCLMQISTRTEDFVVDTLKLREYIGPCLRGIFMDAKKRKVMHGANNDILWLQRDFDIYVCNLFDTMQASRVMALERNSLEFLLQNFCGVVTNKEYQTSDWRIRPLPEEMIKYARLDTHYLLYVYDLMRLLLFDGIENFEFEYDHDDPLEEVYKKSYQVCLKLYEKELFTQTSYMNVYGLKEANLDNKQLAIAAALFKWRDQVGRAEDESTGYVLPNKLLLEISKQMPMTESDLTQIVRFKYHPYIMSNLGELVQIIRAAVLESESEPSFGVIDQEKQDLSQFEIREFRIFDSVEHGLEVINASIYSVPATNCLGSDPYNYMSSTMMNSNYYYNPTRPYRAYFQFGGYYLPYSDALA